jgi:hypothetical protein
VPLLDHFHAPLSPAPSWEGFHARWAAALADELNRILPPPFLAEPLVHVGTHVAGDVVEWKQERAPATEGNGAGGVAVQTWAPPAVAQTVPLSFPDEIEVPVYDLHDDRRLLAVIELVSPSNKRDEADRRSFAGKCAAYLKRGVGLIVVDIVTNRTANLHRELFDLLNQPAASSLVQTDLYATAYRPCQRGQQGQLDIWTEALALGQSLPVLPLALRGAFAVPVDLETTYMETRQRFRL